MAGILEPVGDGYPDLSASLPLAWPPRSPNDHDTLGLVYHTISGAPPKGRASAVTMETT
jgi:hypothetical protein